MKLYADYHTHTIYSHGQGTIRDNIEAAIKKGLEEIAIADHGPASYSIKRLGVKDAATLLEIKKEVEKYDRLYPEIKVLTAVEANIISTEGKLDVPRFILEELDKVLAGFHLFIRPNNLKAARQIVFNNLVLNKLKVSQQQIKAINTDILIKVLNNYQLDVITHPGYQVNIDTKKLAQIAFNKGTALEINAKHGYLTEEFVRVAAKEGVKFCLSSDAHAPEQIGNVDSALEIAKNLSLTKDQIINVR